jgi:hypothetical protein
MDIIPLEELQRGHVYRLHSRNLESGAFDGKHGFVGVREKFGGRFLFTEYYSAGGTAWPLADLGPLPEGIEIREYTDTVDRVTGRRVAFDRPVAAGGRGWYFLDSGEASDAIQPVTRTYQPLLDYLESLQEGGDSERR